MALTLVVLMIERIVLDGAISRHIINNLHAFEFLLQQSRANLYYFNNEVIS